jgi:hypothetical protein
LERSRAKKWWRETQWLAGSFDDVELTEESDSDSKVRSEDFRDSRRRPVRPSEDAGVFTPIESRQ